MSFLKQAKNDGGREGRVTDLTTHEAASLLGEAVFRIWGELDQHVQERLFDEAVRGNDALREGLELRLHDIHPRTHERPTGP